MYILHPNNLGRCGHICNASYAVVANNTHAIHLYERLGFVRIGMVKGGFRMPDCSYKDIILFYQEV